MDSKKRIENKYVKDISIMDIDKNTKTPIAWSITKFISTFLWCSTKFVVKNTPPNCTWYGLGSEKRYFIF